MVLEISANPSIYDLSNRVINPTIHLENRVNGAAEFTILRKINHLLLISLVCQKIRHPLRPIPSSLRPTYNISALYPENCVNSCWIYVFGMINPLFQFPRCSQELITPLPPLQFIQFNSIHAFIDAAYMHGQRRLTINKFNIKINFNFSLAWFRVRTINLNEKKSFHFFPETRRVSSCT